MGRALMEGAAKAAGGLSKSIGFADVDSQKARDAAAAVGGRVYDSNRDAAAAGDFLFLAVKPQVLDGVLQEIASAVREETVLVSMAAGWPIARLESYFTAAPVKKPPVVRIMPNTPALVAQGVIAVAPSSRVSEARLAELRSLLEASGMVNIMDEKYLDAVTGLSGSGPAFAYIFIEALADGGVRAGLPRDIAQDFAAQAVLGAAAMVRETGRHPGDLKDMVTSPGGTAIAGVAALERGGLRSAVMEAVEAAYRRSRELGRESGGAA